MAISEDSPWKTALNKDRVLLCNNLDLSSIENHLLQEEVLTYDELDRVKLNAIRSEGIGKLIDLISKKDADTYSSFLEIMKKLKSQKYLYKSINQRCSCEKAKKWEDKQMYGSPDQEEGMVLSVPASDNRIEEMITLMKNDCVDLREICIEKASKELIEKVLGDENLYRISSDVRGRALIIANYEFHDEDLEDINSNQSDAQLMSDILKNLQFEPEIKYNLKAEDIHATLKQESYSQIDAYDALIVVVLSHGGQRYVYGTDGVRVYLETEEGKTGIYSYFFGGSCEALKGKPKIFFVQACQNESKREKLKQQLSNPGPESPKEPNASPDATSSNYNRNLNPHKQADIVKLISSCPGDPSYANASLGGWFIRAVAVVLVRCAHDCHIEGMCKYIQEILKTQQTEDGDSQMATYHPTLGIRQFYFLPGYEGQKALNQQQPVDNDRPYSPAPIVNPIL